MFCLEWSHVSLDSGGFLRIVDGKSKAARRTLPMTPRVHRLLTERHRIAGNPTDGWIFTSKSRDGHVNGDCAKEQHRRALRDSGVEAFEPYVMRHTALTRIAAACSDPFVVMKIAGHSTITMTQRYCHPQADPVGRAFAALHAGSSQVGTKLGTIRKREHRIPRQRSRVIAYKQLKRGE